MAGGREGTGRREGTGGILVVKPLNKIKIKFPESNLEPINAVKKFAFVDKTLVLNTFHLNGFTVLSCGVVYYAITFKVCE